MAARTGTTTTRAHVVLPRDLLGDVDALVGPRQRSAFLADAVREKVRRARLREACDRVAGSLADVDIPGWETPESTSAWVRAMREGGPVPAPVDRADLTERAP